MTSYRIPSSFALSFVLSGAITACSNLTTPPEPEPIANDKATTSTAPAPSGSTTAAAPSATQPPPRPTASSIPAPPDVAAPPPNAKKTASGLAYRTLTPGTGPSPKTTDTVTVNYTGWTTDGKMFDSSVVRNKPISFSVTGVIKGWTEGLQLMKTGEKTRFWIPAELAYGEHPAGGRPGGMLVFDVELISFAPTPPPPQMGAGRPPGHP